MAVKILGMDGEKLVLTQWEKNRKAFIVDLPNIPVNLPSLRWAHPLLVRAIDVETEDATTGWYEAHPTTDDDPPPVFGSYVPKFILEHYGPVLLSVIDHDSDGEDREVASFRLMVRPRMEPGGASV